MDEYANSFVSSVRTTIEKMQYFALYNSWDLKILNLYWVSQELYKASQWFGFTERQKEILKTFINDLVLHYPAITLTNIQNDYTYVNINSNQNEYTWDLLLDDATSWTVQDLDLLMYPDELEPNTEF